MSKVLSTSPSSNNLTSLAAVVEDIQRGVAKDVVLPEGYFIVYGGQFESAAAAARTIGGLSILSILGVFSLLTLAYGSAQACCRRRR